MIVFPLLRLATGPFPPLRFAARFLAAVILPPLLFFIVRSPPIAKEYGIGDSGDCTNEDIEAQGHRIN